jgi:hypothetical protein
MVLLMNSVVQDSTLKTLSIMPVKLLKMPLVKLRGKVALLSMISKEKHEIYVPRPINSHLNTT